MASWLRRRRERPLDCLRLGAAILGQFQLFEAPEGNG